MTGVEAAVPASDLRCVLQWVPNTAEGRADRERFERAFAEVETLRAALRDGVETKATCGCTGWVRPFAGAATFVTAFNCPEHEPARRYYFDAALAAARGGDATGKVWGPERMRHDPARGGDAT
jgi:hypothetical protein